MSQVDLDKELIPLDPTGNNIGLPEQGTADIVPILNALHAQFQEYYASGGVKKFQMGAPWMLPKHELWSKRTIKNLIDILADEGLV